MKVLDTLERYWTNKSKPSIVLGFVLFVSLLSIAAIVIVQLSIEKTSPFKLKGDHQIAVLGVMAAFSMSILAGWISVTNSIKQYTITTLLDSRLSETYMKYADCLSRHYADYERRRAANPSIRETPIDGVDVMALRYILNYFEFIAIGIRRGDFHEDTLRDSLRSILKKNLQMSRAWIMLERSTNDRLYTNLLWLDKRWQI